MDLVYKKIEEITPYNKNPRKNKEAIKYVAESIKEFGFKVPVTIDEDGVIVTGHTRYEASKLLGLKEIPCIIIKDLDDEKIRAFRLADNKVSEFARWNYEALEEELEELKNIKSELFGFIKEDVEIDWDSIDEIDVDNYEEPEHKMAECPFCNHKDRFDHFKKIRNDE